VYLQPVYDKQLEALGVAGLHASGVLS